MVRASGPEHAYSPHSTKGTADDNPANDNRGLRSDRWRLDAPRWAAAIALATLLTATTVHALTPRELRLPPDFDAQVETVALAIMLMPCEHREPGYSDIRVANLRDVARGEAD